MKANTSSSVLGGANTLWLVPTLIKPDTTGRLTSRRALSPVSPKQGQPLQTDEPYPIMALGQYAPFRVHAVQRMFQRHVTVEDVRNALDLSLIHISEPTRLGMISYAVFCLK